MSKFPADFPEVAHKLFTRIFRVYAIIYHSHFDVSALASRLLFRALTTARSPRSSLPLACPQVFESQGAASHLNTSFKHFIYFAHTHGMLEEKEYTALKEPVERLLQQYNSSK